ncbi:MAG: hypothetical protein ABL958_20330, partial [Bdellovibrionia bacterium]
MKHLLLALLFVSATAEAVDLARLDSKIRMVDELAGQIFALTTPGRIRDERRHVSTNAERVRIVRTLLNGELDSLRDLLKADLRDHRLEVAQNRAHSNARLWAIQRGLNERFNSVVKSMRELKVVYDEQFRIQVFGSEYSVLPSDYETIDLTPFDFTLGFARWCESSPRSGLLAHYNRKSGVITWHIRRGAAIAVAGENEDGSPLIESSKETGLSSAFDPGQNKWTRFESADRRPLAAVYNPNTKGFETRTGHKSESVSGVYNPKTKSIQWRASEDVSVAGFYNSAEGRVEWFSTKGGGAACIFRDDTGNLISTNSLGHLL